VQVVESAAACLKPNGRFCGFSPCIEQVQQTAAQLRANFFTDVSCVECLLRFYEVRRDHLAPPCTLTPAQRLAEVNAKKKGAPQGKGKRKADAEPDAEAAVDAAPAEKAEEEAAAPETRVDWGATPQMAARGHTGYLLFARKLVPMSVLRTLLDVRNAADGATTAAPADAAPVGDAQMAPEAE